MVFRCQCFYTDIHAHKIKFSPRAAEAIFIGFSLGQKGWKVLDISTNKIVISRDVKFHEETFQFMANNEIRPKDTTLNNNMKMATEVKDIDTTITTRSNRTIKKPVWLQDYVTQAISLLKCHTALLSRDDPLMEPYNYREAAKDPIWVKAMNAELDVLEKNKIWELVTLPLGKKTIDSKWVHKIKYNLDGAIERFKARLVAKAYNQKYGRYFYESFSLVARSVTVRFLVAIAVAEKWELHQVDVNNAYFHGHLEEEIYF